MRIAIATQKGGTGKTTSSISISAVLGRKGDRVLLIDLDSQANSSKVLLPNYQDLKYEDSVCATILEKNPLPIHKTTIPNVDICPSHILLSNTDMELTMAMDHREARLKNQLQTIQDQYDHIIIDCPPALSWLTINAFAAAETVVIIVSPGYFELDSIVQIEKSLSEVKRNFNPDLSLLGFLFTMSDGTINSRTSLKILRQAYTEKVFKTVIPRNTDIRDAHFKQQDIIKYSPKSKSAAAYTRLIEELGL